MEAEGSSEASKRKNSRCDGNGDSDSDEGPPLSPRKRFASGETCSARNCCRKPADGATRCPWHVLWDWSAPDEFISQLFESAVSTADGAPSVPIDGNALATRIQSVRTCGGSVWGGRGLEGVQRKSGKRRLGGVGMDG